MNHFQFLVPFCDPQPDLLTLLKWAWFRAEEAQLVSLLEAGVLVDGYQQSAPDFVPEPGAKIAFSAPQGAQQHDYPDWPELERGDAFVVLDKPVGVSAELGTDPMQPALFAADSVGFDRTSAMSVWATDPRAGGAWLLCSDASAASSYADAIANGRVSMVWEVLVTKPLFGRIETDDGALQVSAAGNQDGVTALHVIPQVSATQVAHVEETIRVALSQHGSPIVGDARFGGVVSDGQLRIRLFALWGEISGSWSAPQDWWPGEIVAPKPEAMVDDTVAPRFQISAASMHHVMNGHPWVLRDRDTSTNDYPPGTLVKLVHDEQAGPLALYSGEEPIVARVWGHNDGGFADEVETRFDEALAVREPLFRQIASTDIFRLVHGEADRFPGMFVDRLGPIYRATVRSECATGFRESLYRAIHDFDPGVPILELWHTDDIRRRDELPKARVVEHGFSQVAPGDEIIGREHGLRYHLDVWEGIDSGFFADQRDNRKRMIDHVTSGEHWLNLFCHTGAFSVALASKGATTVNVDLSQRYLDRLLDNLTLNGIPLQGHDCHAQDARTFVDETDETFDGIIVDPPTSSSGSGGFWSIQKDYERLLVGCLKRIRPGGRMLVCSNVRKKSHPIEELITNAAKKSKRKISVDPAPPAHDYPFETEFPEGRTFVGVWVSVE